MKNILVIAAHPDDEVLGCGGAMAAHIKAGDQVRVVIMAEGLTSRFDTRDTAMSEDGMKGNLSDLQKVCIEANKVLGVTDVHFENFPDNRMDSVDRLDVVKRVEHHVNEVRPDMIYTHHVGDVNIDHNVIHHAVVTASRPMPGTCRPTLLFFEVASSTEWQPPSSAQAFNPTWYHDISETLDQKLKSLEVYACEMRDWPHARSVKALEHQARFRGANIGVEAAEAFILGRHCIV